MLTYGTHKTGMYRLKDQIRSLTFTPWPYTENIFTASSPNLWSVSVLILPPHLHYGNAVLFPSETQRCWHSEVLMLAANSSSTHLRLPPINIVANNGFQHPEHVLISSPWASEIGKMSREPQAVLQSYMFSDVQAISSTPAAQWPECDTTVSTNSNE